MIDASILQSLLAVKKYNSYSKAADALGVTQSAVSQSIKSLEAKIGVELVSRSGKMMVLTSEGNKLCDVGEVYINELQSVVNLIQNQQASMVGTIHLGTLYGIGKSWVASQMLEFAKMYPELDLKVTLAFPNELNQLFAENKIDCMIVPESMAPEYAWKKLLHEEFAVLVYPKDKKFKISEDVSLKELLEYPIILFEENDPLFIRWCRKKYKSHPKKFHSRVVINSFRHILESVYNGLGISVVPKHVLDRSFYSDKINKLEGDFKILNSRFTFVCKEEMSKTLKLKTLYKYLSEYSEDFKS